MRVVSFIGTTFLSSIICFYQDYTSKTLDKIQYSSRDEIINLSFPNRQVEQFPKN